MVKAKFGALALTVLMGLGAVSPLHGVTEAHALNAPVANSAQQKTVVSTTDDSDGVMSYKDKESGKTFVSEDNGASWMSEEDYNNSHPAINYEWWTYDRVQGMAGTGKENSSGNGRRARNGRNQRGLFRVDAGNDRPVHCRI